jgi:hypothetical protein
LYSLEQKKHHKETMLRLLKFLREVSEREGIKSRIFLLYLKVAVSGIGATVRGWIPTLTANQPKMMIGKLKKSTKT